MLINLNDKPIDSIIAMLPAYPATVFTIILINSRHTTSYPKYSVSSIPA